MTQPEWLQANKQVYSKEHGVIHIAAIIQSVDRRKIIIISP
ncbi:hypothetical protein [Nostoc sp. LPT]|nr:hypothetical protein [Nostoc sp. LPT]